MINLKQEIQNFKWTHHKLDDNFGMTLEQSKKVNELITLAHNNAVDEMSQLFDLYLEEAKEFERGVIMGLNDQRKTIIAQLNNYIKSQRNAGMQNKKESNTTASKEYFDGIVWATRNILQYIKDSI
jgi:uncharacterized protein YbaP (TraB family)